MKGCDTAGVIYSPACCLKRAAGLLVLWDIDASEVGGEDDAGLDVIYAGELANAVEEGFEGGGGCGTHFEDHALLAR
ncbi:MAG: hypothetical protein NVSMB27_30740 [Ktedonobacteraceae bacterium]